MIRTPKRRPTSTPTAVFPTPVGPKSATTAPGCSGDKAALEARGGAALQTNPDEGSRRPAEPPSERMFTVLWVRVRPMAAPGSCLVTPSTRTSTTVPERLAILAGALGLQ